MRLQPEQTKRIMECIAEEMGVELGNKIMIEDEFGGMVEVIVDSGGLLDKLGNPVQSIMPILRGSESFKKVPWEPALGQLYHYPAACKTLGIDSDVWTNTTGDRLRRKRVGIYRTKEEAIQKARELGWV